MNSEGYTLLMLAAQHNHEALLRDLLKIDKCPLDYRHMMVWVWACVLGGECVGKRCMWGRYRAFSMKRSLSPNALGSYSSGRSGC